MSDRRQRRSEGWAAHLDPQRVRHEKQLAAITGQYPTIHCDTKHDQLVVSFDRPLILPTRPSGRFAGITVARPPGPGWC